MSIYQFHDRHGPHKKKKNLRDFAKVMLQR
jgi:hypothetical protein